MSNDISKIDSNFKVSPGGSNLNWFDACDLHVSGKGWEQDQKHFRRLPEKAKDLVTPEVWRLSTYSSGLSVYFETNSKSLSIHWKLKAMLKMGAMTSTGANGFDLYLLAKDKWRFVTSCSAMELENNIEVMAFLDDSPKKYCLNLPLFSEPEYIRIGVDEGSKIKKIIPFTVKPIMFYGTSIVHGSAASRPGMIYPSQICRALSRPLMNLAFSGNAKMEIEIAHLLGEQDPALYVIDPLPNMDAEMVKERAYLFLKYLLEKKKGIPVLMISCIPYTRYGYVRSSTQRLDGVNPQFKLIFEKLKAEGYHNLYYYNADEILGDDYEGTIDGTHPNDLGFYRIAQNLIPVIKEII